MIQGRFHTASKAVFKILENDLKERIDENLCPQVSISHKRNVLDDEVLTARIDYVDTIDNTIRISNETGMSFYSQGKTLTGKQVFYDGATMDIIEHVDTGLYSEYDTIKMRASDIQQINSTNDDSISIGVSNSIFLSTERISIPRFRFAGRNFYKTEAFILRIEIKTRNDIESFILADITEAVIDSIDQYNGYIPLCDDETHFVHVLDGFRSSETAQDGASLQKRTLTIILGYNVM